MNNIADKIHEEIEVFCYQFAIRNMTLPENVKIAWYLEDKEFRCLIKHYSHIYNWDFINATEFQLCTTTGIEVIIKRK